MTTKRIAPAAIALVVAGVLCIGLRLYYRQGKPTLSPGDTTWRLTYRITGQAKQAGAQLHAAYPSDTRQCRVFNQEVKHSDLDPQRTHTKRESTREIGALARKPGAFTLESVFDLHLRAEGIWKAIESSPPRTAEDRASYLRSAKGIEVEDKTVAETLEQLRADPVHKEEFVERVFDFCLAELKAGGKTAPSDAAAVLAKRVAGPQGRARAMVALCRAGHVPARLVTGLDIHRSADLRPHTWVEALLDGRWEVYDPVNGFAHDLPHNFVPIRHDGAGIVRDSGMSDVRLIVTSEPIPPPPGVFQTEGKRLLDIVNLTRLPLEMHEPLAVILLMPFGALLTSLFRTVIGIRTFGTFTPTLLALAFVYNDWRTGLIIFFSVLILGLLSRTALDNFKLLMVPRLSVMLTLVVLTMCFGVSLLIHFELTPSAEAVLLPMVILTMTVERYYLTSEEDSPKFALQLLTGTLFLGFLCYLVLRWNAVGRLVLAYPETHFLTIAALMLLGRYTGYRLVEMWRFRDLARGRGIAN